MSTQAVVVISPAIDTIPVVTRLSQATLAAVSCSNSASRTASEIWSATLSGCPSETDSEVKRYPDMRQVLLKKINKLLALSNILQNHIFWSKFTNKSSKTLIHSIK